jgi:CubicO group peptidase (beta-lactamase class C family)
MRSSYSYILHKAMTQWRQKSIVLAVTVCLCFQSYSQLTTSQYQKIDEIFSQWNVANHPGGAIGIMKDGKQVFSKAYGLASLEYLVPNSTETLFNVASVSKQFTAMGIVLLHLQGKLSIDDPIKKYMPELPDFSEKITIRQMLHHTSGLRSLHTLFALAGWRGDDFRTNEDLYRIMKDQRDLNFPPGSEYMYCNTGYMYMAKIIEEVTEEKFTDWMKKSIFEPLGMNHTYIEDKYNRVVPNNATSYYTRKKGFDRAVEYWGYVGSGNMHSTSQNLLTWLENFSVPKPGWEKAFQMMLTLTPLSNGTYNDYAFGVRVDSLKGIKRIQHGGSIGGYRSFIGTYPDERLSIAIITNFSTASPNSIADKIAKILLKDAIKKRENSKKVTPETIKLSPETLQNYVGLYWNDKTNVSRKIYVKNDTLRYERSENNETPLLPIKKNEFQLSGRPVKVRFGQGRKEERTMTIVTNNSSSTVFNAFQPVSALYLKKIQQSIVGEYFSPELKTSYYISTDGKKIIGNHIRHGNFEMKIIKKDVLRGNSAFQIVKLKRNQKGNVIGVFVSNSRVRNLWFEKRK